MAEDDPEHTKGFNSIENVKIIRFVDEYLH